MSNQISYNCLSFCGEMLKPGFSIYMFELIHNNTEHYYYLGMTGDNYYPSARSAIHRLSGHFERAKKSTQNQMKIKLDSSKEIELDQLEIKMHHWSIPDFKKWEGSLKNFRPNQLSTKDKSSYDAYKKNQKEVLKLENALIHYLKKDLEVSIINRTNGVQDEAILKEYAQIKIEIDDII